jgi:hypothetical protein
VDPPAHRPSLRSLTLDDEPTIVIWVLDLDKHTAYFNILDALPKRGCVVCRLGHGVDIHYITDVLYSQTTSVETRAALRKARGFCLRHARLLDQIGHALDLSIIYQDVLITLRQALEAPSPRKTASRRGKRQLFKALGPQAKCPACLHRAELEAVYVETLLDHLEDAEFVAKVRSADPLCLSHYCQAAEQPVSSAQFQTLRAIQVEHWNQLIAELGEFVRKQDHRFHHETVGQEGDAWIRAIDAVIGTRAF